MFPIVGLKFNIKRGESVPYRGDQVYPRGTEVNHIEGLK